MDTRTQDHVEDWNPRSFSDGFDGLRDLADGDFTGAVDGGGTWLFMLNGRAVGVFDGTIDSFEGATGTAYRAPDPALVMLCTMWETGGETKAKYYTNETPVEEVDETLSSGSFTGYIELSENVLSGDYYVCYYGGRSLPVAFVGNNEQLLTGDEAFDRANDEVGIYEVRDVDVSVVEIPEPEPEDEEDDENVVAAPPPDETSHPDPDPSEGEGGANGGAAERSEPSASESAASGYDGTESATDDGPSVTANIRADQDPTGEDDLEATAEDVVAAPPPDDGDDGEPSTSEPPGGSDRPTERSDSRRRSDDRSESRTQREETTEGTESRPERSDRARTTETEGSTREDRSARSQEGRSGRSERDTRSDRDGGTRDEARGGEAGESPDAGTDRRRTRDRSGSPKNDDDGGDPLSPAATSGGESDAGRSGDRLEREAAWRETTTIPSIDPDNSSEGEATAAETGTAVAAPPADPADEEGTNGAAGTGRTTERSGATTGEPLEREMLEREDKIDRLQQQVSDLEGERDELRATAERLRAEAEESGDVDRLREENERLAAENEQLRERATTLEAEVDSLENEVDRLEAALEEAKTSEPEAQTPSGQEVRPAKAISGTNLFVRYDSKGQDTLADAHSGTATKDDVNGNLRLEHHTSFDAGDVVVGDQRYETFLEETIVFGLVDWVVRTLLFEIRDTGNQDALRELYDTLPEIDRAELDGTVELDPEEEADVPAEIRFDVVLRNRMGAPLVVANVNENRDPASEGMMVGLNEDANAVKERHDELVGAFLVTTSFFSPGALETADEATSGSLLSRDSRKSFVKLSRKRGYHLCLVETRDGNFHVNVPEL